MFKGHKKNSSQQEPLTQARVLEVLKQVKGPQKQGNIVDLGLVKDLLITDNKVIFSIEVPQELAPQLEGMRAAAEKVVSVLPGAGQVLVALTAQAQKGQSPVKPPMPSKPKAAAPAAPRQSKDALAIPGVRHIIAVASGKGGVGKSTTSVNMALALSAQGLKVGILDADIYGPSLPKLMGVSGSPTVGENNIINPHEAHGIKLMSIGFLVDDSAAMIWRGPMITSALNQMLREVAWGELDVLIIDMPPGTGDVQLTMAQRVPLSGAIVVSTPQDLALIDARRAIAMFEKTGIKILGVVENMSHFVCPSCGERHDIFATGGAKEEADKQAVPFLGEVPLSMKLREYSDAGTPVLVANPKAPEAVSYNAIARQLQPMLAMSKDQLARPAPKIIFE
ncbi:Mrp/NBP35 family ATP-binding protein [Polycladidibacter stylochi]|uniref:Mrp/NBP35 family ATP-binding protein n=1 Tax=Polycladidibacter stylochi TaxID=1807766 RepID=UPI000836F3C5|nr:Mrp/NBP35 family ATP-binding protein [Pseudovibrio stylochi]